VGLDLRGVARRRGHRLVDRAQRLVDAGAELRRVVRGLDAGGR
ncbi:MAG: hypothetical protein RL190_841, partial [Actinomycetota bacterium]